MTKIIYYLLLLMVAQVATFFFPPLSFIISGMGIYYLVRADKADAGILRFLIVGSIAFAIAYFIPLVFAVLYCFGVYAILKWVK